MTNAITAPGLAIVRCGDKSLHPTWANDTRLFDVAISYFGADDARIFPEARYVHRKRAGKWDGIFDFFRAFPDLIGHYRYFWFPDDDLALSGADADRLLEIGMEHDLDLFQPALDWDSYFTHLITMQLPDSRLHLTNFVEIMAPVLSHRLIVSAIKTMSATRSGFGLDFLWPQMVRKMRGGRRDGCAIVDAVTMTHTRPVGSALKTAMAADGGRSGLAELQEVLGNVRHRSWFFWSLGQRVPRKRIFGIIDHDKQTKSGVTAAGRVFRALLLQTNSVKHVRRWKAIRFSVSSTL